ncbi:MAG: BamA/TamA family outer membrane protein, partial [Phycisphaerales bacterium]|nr:BamA/TamA family outer membrane protein [Phycisphaerales bacterium]
ADVAVRTLDRQSTERAEADLVVIVREGKRSVTGVVSVKGNQFTQSRVIRRQVKVLPDRPLDVTSLAESERRLDALRIFAPGSVHITSQAEDPANPGTRDVLVELTEGSTGSLGFGAAASSDGGVVGSISLVQRNFDVTDLPDSLGELLAGRSFRGAGQTFSAIAQPGSQISTYSLNVADPYLFDSDYSGSAGISFRERKYAQYDEDRTSLGLSVGRRLGERWMATASVRAEKINIRNIDTDAAQDLWDVEGDNSLTSLAVKLRRTTLDRQVRPTRGTILEFNAEQVGALGGDYSFTKLGAQGSLYVPVDEDALGLRTVLLLRSAMFWIPDDKSGVPVYERFFQGGREFRGFRFRGFGPREPRHDDPTRPARDTTGGTWSFFAGAQVEKPLVEEYISGVVFLDSGTLAYDPGFSDYRASVGVGLRVYIPALGPVPLAFDYGFAFLKQDGDRTRGFSFSLDIPFQ